MVICGFLGDQDKSTSQKEGEDGQLSVTSSSSLMVAFHAIGFWLVGFVVVGIEL